MTDKITILIIDDEMVSRYTLAAILEPDNYTLVFAEDGKQGLEKAKTISPDLVLLDVMMPQMNGFEVCRRLRTYSELVNTPVVMVTAWNDPIARARCLEMGANEVVYKPIDRIKLQALVLNLTQSQPK